MKKKNKADLQELGEGQEVIAAKKNKAEKLNVIVFEPEGGAPYVVQVSPDAGSFKLPKSELSFKISRGSVWLHKGAAWCAVNAGNPQTVNIHTMTGNDILDPVVYNADINNNLAEQVAKIARTKPVWARGTTWGLLGMGALMGLLMFWLIKTTGSGFEDLGNAIENIKVVVQNNSSTGAGADASTHNSIAPEGP